MCVPDVECPDTSRLAKLPNHKFPNTCKRIFHGADALGPCPKVPFLVPDGGSAKTVKGSIIAPVIIDVRSFLELATERALHMRTEYERAKG